METTAECITNFHGRLLRANSRFCRIFGLKAEEVEWHYQQDIHRVPEDWQLLQQSVEASGAVRGWRVRLRNRKGRSFPCIVERERIVEADGSIIYVMRLEKVAAEAYKGDDMPIPQTRASVVYLTVCDCCGKVRDNEGAWVEPNNGRPASLALRGIPSYCPICSEQQFPDLHGTVAYGQ